MSHVTNDNNPILIQSLLPEDGLLHALRFALTCPANPGPCGMQEDLLLLHFERGWDHEAEALHGRADCVCSSAGLAMNTPAVVTASHRKRHNVVAIGPADHRRGMNASSEWRLAGQVDHPPCGTGSGGHITGNQVIATLPDVSSSIFCKYFLANDLIDSCANSAVRKSTSTVIASSPISEILTLRSYRLY